MCAWRLAWAAAQGVGGQVEQWHGGREPHLIDPPEVLLLGAFLQLLPGNVLLRAPHIPGDDTATAGCGAACSMRTQQHAASLDRGEPLGVAAHACQVQYGT